QRRESLRQIILRACDPDDKKRLTTDLMHQAVCKLIKTTSIVLNIVGIDYESLDEGQLIRDIITRLGLCIISSKKKRGSVLLELNLTPAQADSLLSVVKAGVLIDLGFPDAGPVMTQPGSSHFVIERQGEIVVIPPPLEVERMTESQMEAAE